MNLIKGFLLLAIVILNSAFVNLDLFQKNSTANTPFKVIRTLPDGSEPTDFKSGSNLVFFYTGAYSAPTRWVADGTAGGTQLQSTLLPNLPADAKLFGEAFGISYFHSQANKQVWRSDGTNAGTFSVTSVGSVQGIVFMEPVNSITFGGNNYAYWQAYDTSYKTQLYVSDGTAVGTSALFLDSYYYFAIGKTTAGLTIIGIDNVSGDTNVFSYNLLTRTLSGALATFSGFSSFGGLSINLQQGFSDNSKFYFSLHPWGGCDEMFVTDGTNTGTYNLSTTQYCGLHYAGTANDGSVLFAVQPGFNHWKFYKTNGTSAADWTELADTGLDGQVKYWLVDFNATISGKAVVRFYVYNDGAVAASCPIWVSDGTPGGTTLVTNSLAIHEATDSSLRSSDFKPVVFNNKVYFQGTTAGLGQGVWMYDGIAAPTNIIGSVNFQYDIRAVVAPTYFIFNGQTTATGYELYRSDGTAAGTYLLKDIYPGTGDGIRPGNQFTAQTISGKIVFAANNFINGTELWSTDGTTAGTNVLALLDQSTGKANISRLQAFGTKFYFTAIDDTHGEEPWVSDGTTAGTVLLKDTNLGPKGSGAKNFAVTGSGVVFQTYSSSNTYPYGEDIWSTDGTNAGTNNFMTNIALSRFESAGGFAYFAGYDATNGQQLWKTGGTVGTTSLVKRITATGSAFDYSIDWFYAFGNSVLFDPTKYGNISNNPWISDGTAAGTLDLAEIVPGNNNGSYPTGGVQMGSQFIFTAADAAYNYKLYGTDGTPAGTLLIKDINPGFDNKITLLSTINGRTVFSADDGVNGLELWSTDGTPAGTVMIQNFSAGSASTVFNKYAVATDASFAYLTVKPSGQNWQLWKSDGTSGGTSLIYTFAATDTVANETMISAGNFLFFVACTASHGCELWRSDKTAGGTRLFWDLTPGPASTNPTSLIYFNGQLYFVGRYKKTSTAIWSSSLNSH